MERDSEYWDRIPSGGKHFRVLTCSLTWQVPAFRAELGRMCQAALRVGGDEGAAWKSAYRAVLRKEPVDL